MSMGRWCVSPVVRPSTGVQVQRAQSWLEAAGGTVVLLGGEGAGRRPGSPEGCETPPCGVGESNLDILQSGKGRRK